MPSQKNQDEVIQLMEKLDKATAVYFTDYLGLDVSGITKLRSCLLYTSDAADE